jgi:hypothetical protein
VGAPCVRCGIYILWRLAISPPTNHHQ